MKKNNYSSKNYVNPYFTNKAKNEKQKISFVNYDWIKIIKRSAITIIVFFLIWFFLLSSIFTINNIEINGLNNVESDSIVRQLSNELINEKIYWLIPNNNILLFSKDKLDQKIKIKFNFEKIEIKKRLFHTISINITARQESIIWQEADKYYAIDLVGNIINEISVLNSSSSLPIIYNQSDEKISNRHAPIEEAQLNFVINIYNEFKGKNHGDIQIDKFSIDNEPSTIKMISKNGLTLYFNSDNDLNSQITKLDILIKEKIKNKIIDITYIDLRHGEIINYK